MATHAPFGRLPPHPAPRRDEHPESRWQPSDPFGFDRQHVYAVGDVILKLEHASHILSSRKGVMKTRVEIIEISVASAQGHLYERRENGCDQALVKSRRAASTTVGLFDGSQRDRFSGQGSAICPRDFQREGKLQSLWCGRGQQAKRASSQ